MLLIILTNIALTDLRAGLVGSLGGYWLHPTHSELLIGKQLHEGVVLHFEVLVELLPFLVYIVCYA